MGTNSTLARFENQEPPTPVEFPKITSALYKIKSGIRKTECSRSSHLSDLTGVEIYLKKEFLQITGSFKERGVRHVMTTLSPEEKQKGVVTASTGNNNAQACCYQGADLKIPVTIILPKNTPVAKIKKCLAFQGKVILEGDNLAESRRIAKKYAKDHGMTYIDGSDDPKIIAGQGTVGLEIWEQVPELHAVLVSVGGGALLAGITTALKNLNKDIKVIAVESQKVPCLSMALKIGAPIEVPIENGRDDDLALAKIGRNSFETMKGLLDKSVIVKEKFVALAMRKIFEFEKSIVDKGTACTLAAILQGSLPELRGKNVCLVLGQGDIYTSASTTFQPLNYHMNNGPLARHFLMIRVRLSKKFDGIERLLNTIGQLGVQIKNVKREKIWNGDEAFLQTVVNVFCECVNEEHRSELRATLARKYSEITFESSWKVNIQHQNVPSCHLMLESKDKSSGKLMHVSSSVITNLYKAD